jgi:hypothetical protein
MSFATYNDGTAQTGIILAVGGGQYLAGAEIQRSTNSVSGSWEDVASFDDVSATGTAFIDLLPLDAKTRYYRVRHVEPGYNTGPWSSVISGVPAILPDEDFTGKVFTRSNSTNLSLVFVPISESTTVLRVSSSINYSPGGGSPAISVSTATGVGSVTSVSDGVYDIDKLTMGSGYVTFQNTLSGFVDDFDTVNVGNQQDALLPYLIVRANVTAQSSTSLTISCSVNNPLNTAGASISYVVQPTGAVSITGTNPFTVTRPIGSGSALALFTATQAGFNSDTDPVVITPTPLPALAIRSELISAVNGTYTYAIRGVDPIPESPLTFTMIGVNASVSPTTITTAQNTPFTLTIVGTSLGNGRVTIRATSPRRSDGTDAIDITADANQSAATVEFNGSQLNASGLPYFAFRTVSGSTTRDVELYVLEETVLPATSQSVSYDVAVRKGYQHQESPFTRGSLTDEKIWFTSIPASRVGSWLTVWLVPIDSNGKVGMIINTLFPVPTTTGTLPNVMTSATVSTTSTTTTNSVTMPASNLPTFIRVYRDGVIFGVDIAVTAGASATQILTHFGVTPNTLHEWEYAPVNAAGEGAKTLPLQVTTSAQQLTPPTGEGAGLVNSRLRFLLTNVADYPEGTTFAGDYNLGASWLLLNTIASDTLESAETYTSIQTGTVRFRASHPAYTTSDNSAPVSFTSGGNLQ